MLSSRTVHAVAIGTVVARTSCWFSDPQAADQAFDSFASSSEMADLTLTRFDLEVPMCASAMQITDMVDEATYGVSFVAPMDQGLQQARA